MTTAGPNAIRTDAPRTTRRQFLETSVAATVAWGLSSCERVEEKPMDVAATEIPVVDTHQHLWDLERFELPWLKGNEALEKQHLFPEYDAATVGIPVVQTVYMEVDVAERQLFDEADWAILQVQSAENKMAGAIIGGRPDREDFAKTIDRYRENREIKGTRRVLQGPGTPPGFCLGGDFVQNMHRVGAAGWTFDLCLRGTDLSSGAELAKRCADTQFVLDHCGNPVPTDADLSAWRDSLSRIAERPNVVCKVSGFVANAKGAWTVDQLGVVVEHVRDRFGEDRILFGSDWPVCNLTASLKRWYEALQEITASWSAAQKRKLFHDNAVRIYRLA